jgi:hypothetical protein
MSEKASSAQLKPQTLSGFETYIREAEAVMEAARRDSPFVQCDTSSQTARQVPAGEFVAHFFSGSRPFKVPGGLIHDWIGTGLIRGATIEKTLALVQDYDHHKNIYQPEVIASKLVRQRGNDFQIYLRLLKKKILTVVLDTDHEVLYRCVDPTRWTCWSRTTRVAEVENAGTSAEKVLPPDTGYGFLWRLNSYWQFVERDSGVYLECRAISLTRDVPLGMGWIIEPIIQRLPKESLIHTLECTRLALQTRQK